MIVAELLESVTVSGIYIALIVALLWGFLNIFVRPILIFITLPLNVITFGLFTFIINGSLLLFLASFVDGLSVDSLIWAIVAAMLVAVLNWFGNYIIELISTENR